MGREGEREGNIDVWEKHGPVASHTPPTGDLASNPGMCPDWEWNQPALSPLSPTPGRRACIPQFFLKSFFILFLERGRGEKERERNISMWLPLVPPTGDLAHNPGMCPDWELNQDPLVQQASTQFTEPHQPGHIPQIFMFSFSLS